MTRVVNLRREHFDVYIGRAGRGYDGYFGNPVCVGRRCSECDRVHSTPVSTIPCFTVYFYKRLKDDPEFAKRVEQLRGKTLGCFCKPKPCHGDVISQYLERTTEDTDGDTQ